MLPLHLMSLHEISTREERTMALCVKKPNNTCPWDDQTATTAASPSTSTPPSEARFCHDDDNRLLRRLWGEFRIVENNDKYVETGKCEHPSPALQFCSRIRHFLEFDNDRLSSDISSATNVFNRRRNRNIGFGDRIRYGLQSKPASSQQRWLQLRKFWRHNARRRLRKVERNQHVQQLPIKIRTAEEVSTYVSPTKISIKSASSCDNYNDNNIFHNIFCRYRCQNSKELLWRYFRLLEFRYSRYYQQECQQQQCHQHDDDDEYLQQTKLRLFGQPEQQQQLSTRTIFQYTNETTQGQSNIVTAKSSQIPPRPSHPHNISNLQHLFQFVVVTALLCSQLSNKLYTYTKSRNSRRRTICDSMSPISLARSEKCLRTETFARLSKRTRPSVCMLQSITLVSHPRNRYVSLVH